MYVTSISNSAATAFEQPVAAQAPELLLLTAVAFYEEGQLIHQSDLFLTQARQALTHVIRRMQILTSPEDVSNRRYLSTIAEQIDNLLNGRYGCDGMTPVRP